MTNLLRFPFCFCFLLLSILTLTTMQVKSGINASGENGYGTFFRKARSWVYGESTDETQSSWWNLEPVTSWYHAVARSAKESIWWFPVRTENIRETSLGIPGGTSTATGTSWWKYGWASAGKDGNWNLADTFKSVSTYFRGNRWMTGLEELKSGATHSFKTVSTYLQDCRWWIGLEELKSNATDVFNTASTYIRDSQWWIGLEELKSSATDIFNTVSTYLRECRWWPGLEELKSSATKTFTTVTQYLEKNTWLLILALVVVVASLAIRWWYKYASKARKKQLRRELELVPDTRMVDYLRFLTNDFNISENARGARPSHSDKSLLTPLSSATASQDQPESQEPVNFMPTVDVECTVTLKQNIIWFEYSTADYY